MMNKREYHFGLGAVITFLLYVFGMPLLLIIAAGDWRWEMGWVFFGVHVFFSVGARVLIAVRNPALLAERANSSRRANMEGYDHFLAPFVGLLGPLLSYILMGLDHRFGWSPVLPAWVEWGSMLVTAAMYAFASWGLVANAFFSGVMRVQDERGHSVVSTGPYAVVRHPGYAGALGAYIVTPFALNALWGLLMSALLSLALVIRTVLEDRALHAGLNGYEDYARRVRWRLFPGIW